MSTQTLSISEATVAAVLAVIIRRGHIGVAPVCVQANITPEEADVALQTLIARRQIIREDTFGRMPAWKEVLA